MSEVEIVSARKSMLVLGLGFGGNGCLEPIFLPFSFWFVENVFGGVNEFNSFSLWSFDGQFLF